MGRFSGKTAIVTGAAQGMGAAVACRLVADGANVCLVDRDRELLRATADSLMSDNVLPIAADVSSRDDVYRYVDAAVRRFGAIHLLHNNAAITGKPGPVLGLEEDDVRLIFGVNLMGSFHNIKAVVPHMQAAGGGAIVNMSSLFGIRPAVGMGVYGASKGAIISLTKTLSHELAPTIRVNSVAPGAVDTKLLHDSNAEIHDPNGPSFEERLRTFIPLKRAATAVEAANLITWLLSDEASYVSGAVYHVDGALGA